MPYGIVRSIQGILNFHLDMLIFEINELLLLWICSKHVVSFDMWFHVV